MICIARIQARIHAGEDPARGARGYGHGGIRRNAAGLVVGDERNAVVAVDTTVGRQPHVAVAVEQQLFDAQIAQSRRLRVTVEAELLRARRAQDHEGEQQDRTQAREPAGSNRPAVRRGHIERRLCHRIAVEHCRKV